MTIATAEIRDARRASTETENKDGMDSDNVNENRHYYDNSLVEACSQAVKGETMITKNTLTVKYYYEVISKETPIKTGYHIESAVQKFLTQALIIDLCNSKPASGSQASLRSIRGIQIGGTGILTENDCLILSSDVSEDLPCHIMVSSNTIFLDDNILNDSNFLEILVTDKIYNAFKTKSIDVSDLDAIYKLQMITESELQQRRSKGKDDEEEEVEIISPIEQSPEASVKRGYGTPVNHISFMGIMFFLFSSAFLTLTTLYLWVHYIIPRLSSNGFDGSLEKETFDDDVDLFNPSIQIQSGPNAESDSSARSEPLRIPTPPNIEEA